MAKPLLLLVTVALAALAGPVFAQYKVVGQDGSVTYTDRPPTASNAKVTALSRRGDAPAVADAALPFELRQVASRFPVTLFASSDCPPCDSARQFLQQRGVPYTERRVVTEEDAAALERAVGSRTVPSATIGSQPLRGLSQTDWTIYLDAAGYPRESKLPRNWQAPTPAPMVERATPPVARNTAPPPQPDVPAPPPVSEGGIKF
jgi:glutaredoxin